MQNIYSTHALCHSHTYMHAYGIHTHKSYTLLLYVIAEWLKERTRPLRPLIRGY